MKRAGRLRELTPLQRRILRFFRDQPQAVETLRGLSPWMGTQLDAIEEAVAELCAMKWLVTDETAVVKGYSLTRDERLLTHIEQALNGAPQ